MTEDQIPTQQIQAGELLTATGTADTKTGWKTTEFWMLVALMVLSNVTAFGLVAADSLAARAIGAAITTICNVGAYLGYTWARARLKLASGEQATAAVAAQQQAAANATNQEALGLLARASDLGGDDLTHPPA